MDAGKDLTWLDDAPGGVVHHPEECRHTARFDFDEEAAADLLAVAALGPEFLHREATELSGGERQRVCLARTLATGPTV